MLFFNDSYQSNTQSAKPLPLLTHTHTRTHTHTHTHSPRLRLHFTEFSPFIVSPKSASSSLLLSPGPHPSLSLCLLSELLFALCHRPFTDLALICPLCSIAPLYRDKIAQNIQTCLRFLLCGATRRGFFLFSFFGSLTPERQ